MCVLEDVMFDRSWRKVAEGVLVRCIDAPRDGADASLEVRVGNATHTARSFATVVVADPSLEHPPTDYRAVASVIRADAVTYLVGACEILICGGAPPAAFRLLRLHREADDDQGFHRERVVATEAGCVLVYESGATLLGEAGARWHETLLMNDEFVSLAHGELIFYRPPCVGLDEEWFALRATDGCRRSLPGAPKG